MPEPVVILLVEDNLGDVVLVREYLELAPRSYRLEHRSYLRDAVETLRSRAVHVVLCDLGLPDARGLDCVRTIREAAPDTPLAVVSGRIDADMAASCVEAGARACLKKDDLEPDSIWPLIDSML